MITVIKAGYKRGYSRTDHLLDDGSLTDMIGRQYRDARAAKRAARSIASRQGSPENGTPIYLDIEVRGERIEVTA